MYFEDKPFGTHRHSRAKLWVLVRFSEEVFAQVPRRVGMKDHQAIGPDDGELIFCRQNRADYGNRAGHERSAEYLLRGNLWRNGLSVYVEKFPKIVMFSPIGKEYCDPMPLVGIGFLPPAPDLRTPAL